MPAYPEFGTAGIDAYLAANQNLRPEVKAMPGGAVGLHPIEGLPGNFSNFYRAHSDKLPQMP